jgi:hypothetical protein
MSQRKSKVWIVFMVFEIIMYSLVILFGGYCVYNNFLK